MATIQGSAGGATLPTGFNMKVNGWTGDLAIETTDTSGFGDNGYRVREPVIISMDGSITGAAEGGTSTPAPAALLAATADPTQAQGTLTLTAESGNTYSFTATISNINMNRPVDAHMDMTMSYVSSGQITQTWA